MATKGKKELGFEESISRLEEIIRRTEEPVTQLEEMISLVEEGHRLIRHCRSILHNAELRIQTLSEPKIDEENQTDEDDHGFTLS